MPQQHGSVQKSHNWFVEREMSHVIKINASVKNVIVFTLYKIFVRRCGTIGVARVGQWGHAPPQIFRKYSHFVL